jgi:ribonucleoside-diphosphate reductase alpha chain
MPEYIRTVIVPIIPEELKGVTPKYMEGVYEETEFFKWTKEGDDDILRGVTKDGVVYKIDRNRGLTKEVLCEDYGVRFLKSIGEWDPNAPWAVTTTQLSVKDHVTDLQGFARWTDSACSKTCNIPNDYPFESFKNLYLDVYNTGVIKGFTTYRAGTMASVLAAKDEKHATNDDEEIILGDIKVEVLKRFKRVVIRDVACLTASGICPTSKPL